MARLGFEVRYSGARQYIFESRSRLRDQEYGFRVWVALQAMILGSGVAELANTGNRHDFRYGSNSEVGARNRHVRFPHDSYQTADIAGGPVRANKRLMHRSKLHHYFDHLVREGP